MREMIAVALGLVAVLGSALTWRALRLVRPTWIKMSASLGRASLSVEMFRQASEAVGDTGREVVDGSCRTSPMPQTRS
jgi:hypothetical protein